MISEAEIAELLERYGKQPTPTCRRCGAEMSVARIDYAGTDWRCSGDSWVDGKRVYAAGREFDDEHYRWSHQHTRHGDDRVVRLIEAYRAERAAVVAHLRAMGDGNVECCEKDTDRADEIEAGAHVK